ncbi:MAG TPA: PhnD/SsuA/transferrin family substrate-binding protein [bacterium]
MSKTSNRITVVTALFLPVLALSQNSQPMNFLIVKPGDPGAVSDLATGYLETIANYFTTHTPCFQGKNLHGWIANHPDSAVLLMKTRPYVMAYVPVGFYLKYLHSPNRPATPIAQAPRFGKNAERYYVVTTKSAPASTEALKRKIVITNFGADWDYLRRVVFPDNFQPGVDFELRESQNLADDLFLLIESTGKNPVQNAPAALLLDEELKHFFEADDLAWPQLKIIWTSAALPRDVFVLIGDNWTDTDKQGVLDSLLKMNHDPKGKEMLELMQSNGFTKVDTALLSFAKEQYFSKVKTAR